MTNDRFIMRRGDVQFHKKTRAKIGNGNNQYTQSNPTQEETAAIVNAHAEREFPPHQLLSAFNPVTQIGHTERVTALNTARAFLRDQLAPDDRRDLERFATNVVSSSRTGEALLLATLAEHPEKLGDAPLQAAMYGATQAGLEAAGVDDPVTLYRGITTDGYEDKPGLAWCTTNPDFAAAFAGNEGTVWKMSVPLESVMYTSFTDPTVHDFYHYLDDVGEPADQQLFRSDMGAAPDQLIEDVVDEWAVRASVIQGAEYVGPGEKNLWIDPSVNQKSRTMSSLEFLQVARERFRDGVDLPAASAKKRHQKIGNGNNQYRHDAATMDVPEENRSILEFGWNHGILLGGGPGIDTYLQSLGHSEVAVKEAGGLLRMYSQSSSGPGQLIADHIRANDEVGAVLRDTTKLETQLMDEFSARVEANDDVVVLYRGGSLDKDVQSWTTDPEGANTSPLTYNDRITPDVAERWTTLRDDYSVIGGVWRLMGAPGEKEVTLIKNSVLESSVKAFKIGNGNNQYRQDAPTQEHGLPYETAQALFATDDPEDGETPFPPGGELSMDQLNALDAYAKGWGGRDELIAKLLENDDYQTTLQDRLRDLYPGGEVTIWRGGSPTGEYGNGSLSRSVAVGFASGFSYSGSGPESASTTGNLHQFTVPVEDVVGLGSEAEQEVFFRMDRAKEKTYDLLFAGLKIGNGNNQYVHDNPTKDEESFSLAAHPLSAEATDVGRDAQWTLDAIVPHAGSDDAAIEAKMQNVQVIGDKMLAAAAREPELRAQLAAVGHAELLGIKHDMAEALADENKLISRDLVANALERLGLDATKTMTEEDARAVRDLGGLSMVPPSVLADYVKTLDDVTVGSRLLTDTLQSTWASSSSDSDVASCALQLAIAEKFGSSADGIYDAMSKGQPDWESEVMNATKPAVIEDSTVMSSLGLDPDAVSSSVVDGQYVWSLKDGAEALADTPGVKTFVDATYENTQALLAREGIEEVTSYRGMGFSASDTSETAKALAVAASTPQGARGVEVQLNPASSFSFHSLVAGMFAESGSKTAVGYVIQATVPAERIFSTPYTGPGCLNERELIVLGSSHDEVSIIEER